MRLPSFALERYFAKHEFTAKFLLSSSDCESLPQRELLSMADAATKGLWEELRLGYTESSGHPILRREITNLYESIWPDDVLVVTPEEGIFIAMNALLDPGDHVIVLSPCYQSLAEIAGGIGCNVTPWLLETDGKSWSLDAAFLERSIRPQTRLLVINFPHNPSGFLPSRKQFMRIVEFAQEHKLILFSDEMYRYCEYRKEDRLPAACDLYDKGISLGGLSKTFALPGLRIGWLATKDRFMRDRFSLMRDYTTICGSAPSEILAIIALRARERIIERSLKIIEGNLLLAGAFFARQHRFFDWIHPQASPVAFPRFLSYPPIEKLCEELVTSRGVMLVPGTIFGFPGNHFRIGLGRAGFREGLNMFEEFLTVRFGKKSE